MNAVTNSAIYMLIKKAFTPFAAMHMLKQIQLSHKYKDDVKLTEVNALTHYMLVVKNTDSLNPTTVSIPDSTYQLKASVTKQGLNDVTCSCAFYSNFQMICWHLVHLLSQLQIKNLGAFENLQLWREYVGYKSRNLNDKRDTSTYKVRKERRLKSFIEKVTDKHMDRLKAMAKEKGIEFRMKKIGE
jgi:hypothetical protein